MAHFDPAGDCVYLSKSFTQDFGGHFIYALHPGDHALLLQYIYACRSRPGELVMALLRLTDSLGVSRLTEWKMSLLPPSREGEASLIYAVGVDKVDNYLSGQTPGTLQFLVKLFFDTSPAVQFSIGEAGNILFYNRRAVDFIQAGTGMLPAIGQPLAQTLFRGFAGDFGSRIREAREGKMVRFEDEYLHPDGRREWFRVELMPCSFGEETGISFSLLDVSAFHNCAFAVSHHVRSHLSNVEGISRLMEELLAEQPAGQLPGLIKMIREETLNLSLAVQRVEGYLFTGEQ